MGIFDETRRNVSITLFEQEPSEATDEKQYVSLVSSDKTEYVYLVQASSGNYPDPIHWVLACFKSEDAAKKFADDYEKNQNEIVANCPVFREEDYDDIESEEFIKKENEFFDYWENNKLSMEFNKVYIEKMILR
jgi:hypothetical protein